MRKKRILSSIILAASVFCFLSSTVTAAEQVGVTNKIELGFINIKVADSNRTRGLTTVLPGDKVQNTKVIHNLGSPCYVRALILFDDMSYMTEENIYGVSDKWERKDDGYYYYKDVLNTGDEAELFQGIIIPKNLPQGTYEDTMFSVKISVDAIQSKNFEPEYEQEEPWGEVEVIKSVVEDDADINSLKKPDSQELEIIYPEDMSGLVANQDDFFKNFPYMMPGDEYSDTLTVKNESKEAIELYFKTETDKESETLKDISLKITSNFKGEETLVYSGNLAATALKDGVNLGTVKSEEEKQITFKVGVPATVTNEFSVESSGVEWHFSTDLIEEEGKGDTDNTEPPKSNDNTSSETKQEIVFNGSNKEHKKEEPIQTILPQVVIPKTGDDSSLLLSVIIMIISAIGAGWSIKTLRKQSSQKNE